MTNARKSRERRRMEEAEIERLQEEQKRMKEMADRNEVFTCSGRQEHFKNCDGNCEVRKLDPLEIEINEEHKKWDELGMVPLAHPPQIRGVPGIPVDYLKIEIALAALTEMCYELGVDKDRLNQKYQELYLNRIRTIREVNEEDVKEARRLQQIAISQILPQIEMPPGFDGK